MAQVQPSRQAADRKFRTYFRLACIEVRERADVARSEVATRAGVSENSISRFEKGDTWPEENFDRLLAAYASLIGIDPRELLLRVGRWWKRSGRPPLTAVEEKQRIPVGTQERGPEITTRQLVDEIRRAEQAPGEAEAPPSETRKRQGDAG